eukprot:gene13081-14424_t
MSLGMKLKLKNDAVPRIGIPSSTTESETDHLKPVRPNRRNLNLNSTSFCAAAIGETCSKCEELSSCVRSLQKKDAGETDSSTDILEDRHNIGSQGDNLCLDDFSDQEHHDLDTDWSSTEESCESGDEDFEPTKYSVQ